jgi:hypothetical protein
MDSAKDLPVGAEVFHRGVTYLKGRGMWVSDNPDAPNYDICDGDIDKVLAAGGVIVGVLAGRRVR